MTRSMISSVVSRTMYFCPDVSVITVSGVTSICSIRSEFTISGVWFSLVILIMTCLPFRGRIQHICISQKRQDCLCVIKT